MQTLQYEIEKAVDRLHAELGSINRKLSRLDEEEARRGSLTKGQEMAYDALVTSTFKIESDLASLSAAWQ